MFPSSEFSLLLDELSRPGALPEPHFDTAPRQTHISAVFLGEEFAYKLKKPVRFDFLDFSRMEERRRFLEEELRLNRRLAPEMYLDLLPVVRDEGRLRLGAAADAARAVDWVLRMKRLSDDRMLPALVRRGELSRSMVERLARRLAQFHGSCDAVLVGGNAAAVLEVAGESVTGYEPPCDRREDVEALARFIQEEGSELERDLSERKNAGWVRDVHGDLRLQNICFDPSVGDGLQIFDCIEFTRRFRCIDVLSDIAYLHMDLALHCRLDLAEQLLDEWSARLPGARDERLGRFYLVFRACVRAKIAALAVSEPELDEKARRQEADILQAALDLAGSWAAGRRPLLLALCGYSGSGKSVLARELARRIPAVLVSTDLVRREITGLAPGVRQESDAYTDRAVADVYARALEAAAGWLAGGRTVVLDATFLSAEERRLAAGVAEQHGVPFKLLCCTAPDAVLRERVRERSLKNEDASDADLQVLAMQQRRAPSLPLDEAAAVIDTSRPLLESVRWLLKSSLIG